MSECRKCGRTLYGGPLTGFAEGRCTSIDGPICKAIADGRRRGMREAFSAAIAACTDAIAGDWDPSWRAGATCALELVEMRAGLRDPETGKPIEKAVVDAE